MEAKRLPTMATEKPTLAAPEEEQNSCPTEEVQSSSVPTESVATESPEAPDPVQASESEEAAAEIESRPADSAEEEAVPAARETGPAVEDEPVDEADEPVGEAIDEPVDEADESVGETIDEPVDEAGRSSDASSVGELFSGKSKTEIAKALGVSNPTVSQYCSGRAQPTLATLSKLCNFLDCSADDILEINLNKYDEK